MESNIKSGKFESISLVLDKALSSALRETPELDQQLYETFATLSGSKAVRSDDNVISYKALINENPDSSLTGVSKISISGSQKTITQVDIVIPTQLITAIENALKSEPDAGALALAWQKSLRIVISIEVSGEILRVGNPDVLDIAVNSNKVIVSAPLDQWQAGVIQIESVQSELSYLPFIVGLLFLIFVGLFLLRRFKII
jgi:hypothetical protein